MKVIQIILCLVISFSVFSQKKINPKTGVSVSSYAGVEDSLEIGTRNGFHVGMDLMLGDAFINFQPGIFYYSSDLNFTKLGSNPLKQANSIHSLKIPLNLSLNLVQSKIFDFRLYGGPVGTYTFFVDENDTGINISDIASLVLGADIGVGLDFSFFTIDIVYELGLSDVFEIGENQHISYILPGVKNNLLSLSLGFKF